MQLKRKFLGGNLNYTISACLHPRSKVYVYGQGQNAKVKEKLFAKILCPVRYLISCWNSILHWRTVSLECPLRIWGLIYQWFCRKLTGVRMSRAVCVESCIGECWNCTCRCKLLHFRTCAFQLMHGHNWYICKPYLSFITGEICFPSCKKKIFCWLCGSVLVQA